MHFVLYSVLCSVTVSVLLKVARNMRLDTFQMICWNYPVAVGLTWYFFDPAIKDVVMTTHPWEIYLPLAFLLPTVFMALSASLKSVGIVKTEVAQRLSLIVPLIAAFYLFGERFNWFTGLGLGIGFLAILLCIGWQKKGGASGKGFKFPWLYPVMVFLGYGVCDVLFKKIALTTSIPYTTSIFVVFILAMVVAFLFLFIKLAFKSTTFEWKALLWGLGLGIFNFANILFYMKAHRLIPDNPSIVFAGMNMGVITLGALVGLWIFKEKLTSWNWIGIIFSILAVWILAFNL
jgi:drug/metabolite transporter (DMT)-like permease